MPGVERRVIVLAGAASALGRECAALLAQSGASVVVNSSGSVDEDAAPHEAVVDGIVDEIQVAGGQAVANHDDTTSETGAVRLIQTALDEFGMVHAVVVHAGLLRDNGFDAMTSAEWFDVVNARLHRGFYLSKAAWPHFRAQQHGRLVFVASMSGICGRSGQANYAAAQSGLVGLVNTLAIEGRDQNVRVNLVALAAPEPKTVTIRPLRVLANAGPDEVAPIIGYLVSDECSATANLVTAGQGRLHRVQYFQSWGVAFDTAPTIAQVAQSWPQIADMAGSGPPSDQGC
jgi:NAD(P)-dependent dehydrogenase (short-subunit alcohol dehydrogenase family)